jgi:hypothetical protein
MARSLPSAPGASQAMSSPIVSTVQPGMLGLSIAKFVLPQALGKAAATWNTFPAGFVTLMTSMCSASQPSSCAMTLAIRSANAFFARSALPPYAEPNDQISRVSGKCEMYFTALHGHATSASPSASGAPTECTHGTHSVSGPIAARAAEPIRVMIPVETTT